MWCVAVNVTQLSLDYYPRLIHILIKILAESHMAFDLGDKIDIR